MTHCTNLVVTGASDMDNVLVVVHVLYKQVCSERIHQKSNQWSLSLSVFNVSTWSAVRAINVDGTVVLS